MISDEELENSYGNKQVIDLYYKNKAAELVNFMISLIMDPVPLEPQDIIEKDEDKEPGRN